MQQLCIQLTNIYHLFACTHKTCFAAPLSLLGLYYKYAKYLTAALCGTRQCTRHKPAQVHIRISAWRNGKWIGSCDSPVSQLGSQRTLDLSSELDLHCAFMRLCVALLCTKYFSFICFSPI